MTTPTPPTTTTSLPFEIQPGDGVAATVAAAVEELPNTKEDISSNNNDDDDDDDDDNMSDKTPQTSNPLSLCFATPGDDATNNDDDEDLTDVPLQDNKNENSNANTAGTNYNISTGVYTRKKPDIRLIHTLRQGEDGEEEENKAVKVFRITTPEKGSSASKKKNKSKLRKLICGWKFGNYTSHMISEYLRWTFRVSFLEVTIASYLQFAIITLFFAIILWIFGQFRPSCLNVAGADFKEAGTAFMDTIHMSWTTLSTVGYGVTSPNVPSLANPKKCIGVNAFMAAEAFVGVLFAAIIGSIVFGKVARIQSIAQIKFCHPIVIRYGSGVMENTNNTQTQSLAELETKLSCPVLEFRIVNQLTNEVGGEILDASVNVVGVTSEDIDEKDREYFQSLVGHTKKARRKSKKLDNNNSGGVFTKPSGGANLFGAAERNTQVNGSLVQRFNHSVTSAVSGPSNVDLAASETKEVDAVKQQQQTQDQMMERLAHQIVEQTTNNNRRKKSVAVDEGNSKLAPRAIFHKLDMETDTHPYFRRVWILRHTLNAESPLLSATARKMIDENDGSWPDELNHHSKLRQHLNFREIIVNFSGTANVSGSSVFAVHVYDFTAVNIGYAFVSMLGKSDEGGLVADVELLNDVREQRGGGAEPFQNLVDEQRMIDVLDAFRQGFPGAAAAAASGMTSQQQQPVSQERRQQATQKAATAFKANLQNKQIATPQSANNTHKDSDDEEASNNDVSVPSASPDDNEESEITYKQGSC